MSNKKGPYTVKELKRLSPGTQVWGKYIILEKVHRKTRDGKEIIDLKIGDSSGEIYSIVWDNCPIKGELETGAVIGLLGDLGIYNNRLQITAKRIKILEEDVLSYLKAPSAGIDYLTEEFERTLNSVADPYMKELLRRIFTLEMREKFFQAPAAKNIHHNYRGGLLEHTLAVVNLCSRVVEVYPYLNKDLLITGALLHDIGKVSEYAIKGVPQYTAKGRLIGHIVLGSEILSLKIREIRDSGREFPPELENMLKHMLLSHHGSLEFGSPVVPLFPEAFVLYMLDNLDAKMYVFANKIEEENGEEELFTRYDNFFQQVFFKYRYQQDPIDT